MPPPGGMRSSASTPGGGGCTRNPEEPEVDRVRHLGKGAPARHDFLGRCRHDRGPRPEHQQAEHRDGRRRGPEPHAPLRGKVVPLRLLTTGLRRRAPPERTAADGQPAPPQEAPAAAVAAHVRRRPRQPQHLVLLPARGAAGPGLQERIRDRPRQQSQQPGHRRHEHARDEERAGGWRQLRPQAQRGPQKGKADTEAHPAEPEAHPADLQPELVPRILPSLRRPPRGGPTRARPPVCLAAARAAADQALPVPSLRRRSPPPAPRTTTPPAPSADPRSPATGQHGGAAGALAPPRLGHAADPPEALTPNGGPVTRPTAHGPDPPRGLRGRYAHRAPSPACAAAPPGFVAANRFDEDCCQENPVGLYWGNGTFARGGARGTATGAAAEGMSRREPAAKRERYAVILLAE